MLKMNSRPGAGPRTGAAVHQPGTTSKRAIPASSLKSTRDREVVNTESMRASMLSIAGAKKMMVNHMNDTEGIAKADADRDATRDEQRAVQDEADNEDDQILMAKANSKASKAQDAKDLKAHTVRLSRHKKVDNNIESSKMTRVELDERASTRKVADYKSSATMATEEINAKHKVKKQRNKAESKADKKARRSVDRGRAEVLGELVMDYQLKSIAAGSKSFANWQAKNFERLNKQRANAKKTVSNIIQIYHDDGRRQLISLHACSMNANNVMCTR